MFVCQFSVCDDGAAIKRIKEKRLENRSASDGDFFDYSVEQRQHFSKVENLKISISTFKLVAIILVTYYEMPLMIRGQK